MPRKKPEDLVAEDKTFENEAKKPDAKVVVPASEAGVSKKVKLDLEVDTSVKDLGPNPYARIIHMARAVDSWRIFPRIFISTYIYLLYKVVLWYMALEAPSNGTVRTCFNCGWCRCGMVWTLYRITF